MLRRHPVMIGLLAVVSILIGIAVTEYLGGGLVLPGQVAGGGGPPGAGGRGGPGGFGQAVLVTTAEVSMGQIIDEIEAIGTTEANESVALTAQVTDTISNVNFEDGDFVEAGEILVELTNDEETATLAEARANLDEAIKQYDRIVDLVERGNAAVSRRDEEQAQVETAQARIEAIVARLSDRLITAPFAGILGFRQVSVGTLVTPNTVVTTLDDISLIKLDFSVPETFLNVLAPGLDVIAQSAAWPDREFRGIVTTVGSRVDPVTRAVTVRAIIPNDERALRPGMLMAVLLVRSRDNVMIVPEESLIPVQDRQYVYVVEGSTANRIEVEIGRRRPGIVEILAGLEIGQQVVTQGTMRLRPGVTVQVQGASPGGASGPRVGARPGGAGARGGAAN